MHEGTTNLEVLWEVVLPVYTNHRLTFLLVCTLAFQRYIDCCTCIDNTLIKDCHLTSTVINAIVRTLVQGYTARSYYYRTLWNVIGSKGDNICCWATILANEYELILLGNLLSDSLRRVIELLENVFIRNSCSNTLICQCFAKSITERFSHREEHTSVADSISLNVIKITIGMWIVIIIQSVSIEKFDERLVLYLRFWNVWQIDTCRITLILHVKAELITLNVRSEIIHVFHHQVPVSLLRIIAGILQWLDKECLIDIGTIAGKLTHLIGYATVCIFVGNRQYLISL